MSAYLLGCDIIGDMGTGGAPSLPVKQVYYGPESPMDLKAKQAAGIALNVAEKKGVADWDKAVAEALRTSKPIPPPTVVVDKEPSFLFRPVFGGLKVWQVGLAGVGLVSLAGGLLMLAVRR